MAKGAAREMTDASEVAGLMIPLIEAKIAMEVDPKILEEIGMIVGEVVARMIDNGFTFTAPLPELVVNAVALSVGKRLMGIAVNGVQDAISYAALAVTLGVNPGLTFAILPAGGAAAVEAGGASLAGGAAVVASKPSFADLSVPDAIDALLRDILTAKKPVDDVETLEFLIGKARENDYVEAEIFLLEQMVAHPACKRKVVENLMRLVELTADKDPARAIGYLRKQRAFYAGRKRHMSGDAAATADIDEEIAALGEKVSKAEAAKSIVVAGDASEDVQEDVPGDGFVPEGRKSNGDLGVGGAAYPAFDRAHEDDDFGRGNMSGGDNCEPVQVSFEPVDALTGAERASAPAELAVVPAAPVEVPAVAAVAGASAEATDGLDEKHCPEIAAALRNINNLEFDAMKDMVQVAISENDGDAVEAFRNSLLKAGGNSNNVFALIAANIAVVDILVAAGLYQEAIQHQRRAVELRRMFKKYLVGKIEQRTLDEKLAQLLVDAARNGDRFLRGDGDGAGIEVGGDGDDQIAMLGRKNADGGGAAGDLRKIRAGRVAPSAPDARRKRAMRDNGSSGMEAFDRGREGGNGFARAVDLIMSALQAGNKSALDSYVRLLLDPPFAMSTSKDLRAANIKAANLFEDAGEYERSVRHWQKVLELQEAHPLASDGISQQYIGRTRANLERVRARCPQVF